MIIMGSFKGYKEKVRKNCEIVMNLCELWGRTFFPEGAGRTIIFSVKNFGIIAQVVKATGKGNGGNGFRCMF